MSKAKQAKRVKRVRSAAEVLRALATLCDDDVILGKEVLERLQEPLDDMLEDDLFGTEGQNDPRGDRRREE